MSGRRVVLGLAVLAATHAPPGVAQDVRTAVVPDTIHVGDIFRVAVRVTVGPGTVVTFPDTLDVPENVEAAARRELTVDSAADGQVSYTAVFPLTAWRPGPIELPPGRLSITTARGESVIEAGFRPIRIATLLPADTSQVEPRPAKDVIGPSRLIWPTALGILLLLAALAGAIWAYRRRRPEPIPVPAVPPRDAALAELDRIRKLGYLERGEIRPFYTAVAGVLRGYTAQLDPRWGAQLTTTELWRAMLRVIGEEPQLPAASAVASAGTVHGQPGRPDDGSNEAGELYSMLGRADLVKFARARPGVTEATAVWTDARRWVQQFPPPAPEPSPEEATT